MISLGLELVIGCWTYVCLFSLSRLALIGRAKRAPHWGVQSRSRDIYIYVVQGFIQDFRVGGE